MNSRRTRIGLIVPSSNSTAEYDYQRILDAETSLHTARVFLVDTTIEMLERMNQDSEEAARSLRIGGRRRHRLCLHQRQLPRRPRLRRRASRPRLRRRARNQGRRHDARRHRRAPRSGLAPRRRRNSVHRLHQRAPRRLLRGQGLRHRQHGGAAAGRQPRHRRSDAGADSRLRQAAHGAGRDGFFLSCTNWRAMEVVEELERELGKPVVTSNQATIWASLRAVGRTAPVDGFGALLRMEPGAVSAG